MTIQLLKLKNTEIQRQLALEESLLRSDNRFFVIIGTDLPRAIVMGSSQKKEEVIHLDKAQENQFPIVQRYSAGGCVILDKDCIMVSFIASKHDVPIDLFPNSIMNWSAEFYKHSLPIKHFSLRVNDYTIGDKKIGGNAQYIRKDRFVHHSCFLWDYNPDHMNILTHPPKEPSYRNKRPHEEFLTTIKPHLSKEAFVESIENGLKSFFNQAVLIDQTFC
jgi:lipoate-protein ligase A